MIVEVFKTDVSSEVEAEKIIRRLTRELPHCRCNFDLSDCDKIFRIESNYDVTEKVMAIFAHYQCTCTLL